MAFTSKQCQAKSKSTGKRCRQPAIEGSKFCRLHGGKKIVGKTTVKGKDTEKTQPKKRRGQGNKLANTNALKHGAYSPRLLPDEEPIYAEKRKAFTAALGTVDVFDEQILHLLSLISTKVDQAVLKGAEHAAYGGMIKQILDLMKELKATRASRDPIEADAALSYADLFAALKERFGDMSIFDEGDSTTDEEKIKRLCSKCGFEMPHLKEKNGHWRCQNCGHLMEAELEEEELESSTSNDKTESTATVSNTIRG